MQKPPKLFIQSEQALHHHSNEYQMIYNLDFRRYVLLILRTPELVGLAHNFCARKVSVCSKFIEKNQIIINSMKYAMCNIHINDYYSKYSYPVSL